MTLASIKSGLRPTAASFFSKLLPAYIDKLSEDDDGEEKEEEEEGMSSEEDAQKSKEENSPSECAESSRFQIFDE